MIAQFINSTLRKVPAWPLYVLGAVPPAWLFYSGVTGGLGVDPVKEMEHQMGLWGLWLIIAGLCVTPLRRWGNINLMKFRRPIGILTFFYIAGHLLIWLVLDVQIPSQILADIIKRPYVTIGMGAFVLMIPLVVTSNNWSVRKLGAAKWQKLHKLTYLAAILGGLHFVWLVKGWQIEPMIYTAVIVGLVALRWIPKRKRVAVAA
ncbi:protein-methionine-sulfoxide reductase heme-binding subunit MsrQ [Alphaproteobacteria bacterium KMM 3653]|uniref:Protein-methionine-sulfoxide reductase heme-binding subunit MsrQ n=1 Tax=Harenicola maris TaxID=2841044 RepID=A0AAP2CSY9_9RHOB|nr:protein-methionine-sulfoxide reductase heme-binding subunit MsrQ [Harenicola maris]